MTFNLYFYVKENSRSSKHFQVLSRKLQESFSFQWSFIRKHNHLFNNNSSFINCSNRNIYFTRNFSNNRFIKGPNNPCSANEHSGSHRVKANNNNNNYNNNKFGRGSHILKSLHQDRHPPKNSD